MNQFIYYKPAFYSFIEKIFGEFEKKKFEIQINETDKAKID